jgi:hypothetical protein
MGRKVNRWLSASSRDDERRVNDIGCCRGVAGVLCPCHAAKKNPYGLMFWG